jgi:DNA polymerase epsilon subunit 3
LLFSFLDSHFLRICVWVFYVKGEGIWEFCEIEISGLIQSSHTTGFNELQANKRNAYRQRVAADKAASGDVPDQEGGNPEGPAAKKARMSGGGAGDAGADAEVAEEEDDEHDEEPEPEEDEDEDEQDQDQEQEREEGDDVMEEGHGEAEDEALDNGEDSE